MSFVSKFLGLALVALVFTPSLLSQNLLELNSPSEMIAQDRQSRQYLGEGGFLTEQHPDDWLRQNLRSALGRIVPSRARPGERIPLQRLMEAIEIGFSSRTEIEAVLKDNNILGLNAYFDELHGRIQGLRAEVERFDPQYEASEIDQARHHISQQRLLPAELAAVVFFYFRLHGEEQLMRDNPLQRSAVHRITNAIRIARWPGFSLREHNQNEPALEYSDRIQRTLRMYWFCFDALGLDRAWLEISTQLVNSNSGNKRFRQVTGLEERVLKLIRAIALNGDIFEAKRLFILFLNTYSSSLERDQIDAIDESSFDTSSKAAISLSEFLRRFSTLTNPVALERFFKTGNLPRTRLYHRKTTRSRFNWKQSLQFTTQGFGDYARSDLNILEFPNVSSITLMRSIAFFKFMDAHEDCDDNIKEAAQGGS